jgi:hypothetical protein
VVSCRINIFIEFPLPGFAWCPPCSATRAIQLCAEPGNYNRRFVSRKHTHSEALIRARRRAPLLMYVFGCFYTYSLSHIYVPVYIYALSALDVYKCRRGGLRLALRTPLRVAPGSNDCAGGCFFGAARAPRGELIRKHPRRPQIISLRAALFLLRLRDLLWSLYNVGFLRLAGSNYLRRQEGLFV